MELFSWGFVFVILLLFFQVKDIYLQDELFSLENGLLTPTMKSKRNELHKRFQKEIEEMYKSLD
jgi:long-chain acyl-CoA synthetase